MDKHQKREQYYKVDEVLAIAIAKTANGFNFIYHWSIFSCKYQTNEKQFEFNVMNVSQYQ